MTDHAQTPPDENHLIATRREKLDRLRAQGQAFPNDFRRDTLAEYLIGTYGSRDAASLEAETTVFALAGRLMAKRVMGKASFGQLQDMSGRIQLFVQLNVVGDAQYETFKHADVGDLLGVRGTVFKTKTGELSVKVSELRLLVKNLRPLPEKWAGLTDTEVRYRQRYLDLIVNPEVRTTFEKRGKTVRFIRNFLDALGFIEVETPMLQPIAGGATARPFVTHYNALDRDFYLRIAPELYLKRLVVGGFEKVYEINRNFRNEGLSTRHNPEFTMLEFYQAYADYREAMDLVETLIRDVAIAVHGSAVIRYQGRTYDLEKPFNRWTMKEAVLRHNPDLDASALVDRERLAAYAKRVGGDVKPAYGVGKLLTEIFEKTVETTLLDPTFITEFPTEVSPLARANDADPTVTDRFELFIAGREIANGFSELNDPDDQAARFRAQVAAKQAGDDEAMLFDADYIRALEYGLPPTAGVGVGIDRLVMFLTDAPSIRDVLLFPQMRPEA
ncbi:lysyl-tRNA synthetase, class II [Fontimonas thermophila]|uniref:Lysine--tRNA ligase n=1 Tax=Fontimonas thermophila TaxID=1076937 RepID=A0A1I2J3E8_9GAMM|nr:lysine--tRNA ligase [Fontimonas thermophila]SFF49252.1 lysyl-tRNA synthetase, class II [Fontimonas thermophila]